MLSQKELIHEGGWDVLLILDACRYDSFKRTYEEFLPEGELLKVRSEGSSTGEWLYKTFPDMYDMTYVSTNPYVNSYGIPLSKCNPDYKFDWKAVDHFSHIVDAWEMRWHEGLETVLPDDVNEIYLGSDRKDKSIVHYMQPHLPYINLGNFGSFDTMKRRAKDEGEGESDLEETIDKIMVIFEQKIGEFFGKGELWEMKKMFGIRPRSGYEKTWRAASGKKGLERYYQDNLEIVLESVSELIEDLNGKIVVTSDHGEAFGENGIWFHKLKRSDPVLLEVPWYEIDLNK